MIYALSEGGLRIAAEPGLSAVCPCCRESVVPHCGDLRVWHWAHKNAAECDPWWEPETEWHRSWKCLVPTERTEVILGDHRADLIASDGAIVELQNSPISVQEIREREAFYGARMLWLLNGEPFRGNFRVQKSGQQGRYQWAWPRLAWTYARRPVLIHGFSQGTLLRGPNRVTGKLEPRFQPLHESSDVFQIRTTSRRPYVHGSGRILPLDRFLDWMVGPLVGGTSSASRNPSPRLGGERQG